MLPFLGLGEGGGGGGYFFSIFVEKNFRLRKGQLYILKLQVTPISSSSRSSRVLAEAIVKKNLLQLVLKNVSALNFYSQLLSDTECL